MCRVEVRVIGALAMSDEKGEDWKIIAIPNQPSYEKYNSYTDLPPDALRDILYFFSRYKDGQPGKFTKIDTWVGSDEARSYVERYALPTST